MITHEITKPKPPNLYHQAKDAVLRVIGHPVQERFAVGGNSSMERYMPKIEFAKWVEEIKVKYPVGSLWTFTTIPYVPERAPTPVFRVTSVEEVHWNAPVGEVHQQPRCINVVNDSVGVRCVAYEPGSLRRLNTEEIKLVHIRDQTPDESRAESCVVNADGKYQLLDASGRVIKEYT